jgi:hypothetical protein
VSSASSPNFISGALLAEQFYRQAVLPILDAHFPGLPHSAALIGHGSEVLGFDTPVSADHHWGPRALLFLREDDHTRSAEAVRETLRHNLPHTFLGWPTNFTEPDLDDHGVQRLQATSSGPIDHRVDVLTLRGFWLDYLGFDLRDSLEPCDWLTFPSQKLRSIVTGPVFHDGIELQAARERFAWYPHDVWLYLLAAGWQRIGEEEHLMGRAGQVGDEIGSALIAGRLVRDLMRLCFLMEREHAPYAKWYGTAFTRLKGAGALSPLLRRVLSAESWLERDQALAEAYAVVARMHNALGLTDPLPTSDQPFFERPFRVIFGARFSEALKSQIRDERVRCIPFDIGSIDQWSDSSAVLEPAALRARLVALYRPHQPD